MKYKRRIVYLSDEEWAGIAAQAKEGGVTVSSLIRAALAQSMVGYSIHDRDPVADAALSQQSSQAQRDAILNRINRRSK